MLVSTGCSIVLTQGPPRDPAVEPVCDAAADYAPLDLMGMALFGGLTYFAYFALSEGEDIPQTEERILVGGGLTTLAASLALGGSALTGYARAANCRRAKAAWRSVSPAKPVAPAPLVEAVPMVPLVEAVAARDPMAAQLTQQAHRAALLGQCEGVNAVAPRVRALDREYYEHVFVADPPIAACR